ncbi:MAG: NBR1-Ig-like domain-containing protein, partial [Roseiflexaceae bacterium]|nr:NBR1-Ig-like domain-containing protein [Roseiflexaceae bacterium]
MRRSAACTAILLIVLVCASFAMPSALPVSAPLAAAAPAPTAAESDEPPVTAPQNSATPQAISFVQIEAGAYHTCGLTNTGLVYCWGANWYGQLGNGTTDEQGTPVAVSGLNGAVAITAGVQHTCALLGDGTARCWGDNAGGQLGDGTTTDRLTPVAVSGLSGAVAIAAGDAHTCALLRDGTARCWGANSGGQLGDGTTATRLTPVAVSGLSGAIATTAGWRHTCTLLNDSTARCWGANGDGQLGDGATTNRLTPVAVSGLSGAVALAAGGSHTCALLRDGAARCWGYNYFGQLGDSTTTNRWTPVAVSGLSGAVALAAGFWHTCALLNDGTARCWGYNYFGQLGDGTAGHSPVPVTVVGSGGGAVANCARFVADVNYPDGSIVSPGQVFEKRWRLRNCGTASWSGYQAERMSGIYGPASFPVSGAPGATVEVAATFTAPATPGTHRATYQLRGPNGLFGDPFWVEVVVRGEGVSRRPLIFIPGIMGSYIYDPNDNNKELWPGICNRFSGDKLRSLSRDRVLVPDVIRTYTGNVSLRDRDIPY